MRERDSYTVFLSSLVKVWTEAMKKCPGGLDTIPTSSITCERERERERMMREI